MGVYTADRTMLSETANIPADPHYSHESNIGLMMVEAQQNDLSIFDAVIRSDISSAIRIHEGSLLESEVDTLNEGVIANIKMRIVEGLKKFFAKVRSIFDTFIAKLTSYIVVDGKKFVKMNMKRVNTANLNKIKVNYRKPKANASFATIANDAGGYYVAYVNPEEIKKLSDDAIKTREEEDDDSDTGVAARMFGKALGESGPVSRKDFNSDIIDKFFEDEDEVVVGDIYNTIKDTIQNGNKTINDIKHAKEKSLKDIDSQIKRYNNESNIASKTKDTDSAKKVKAASHMASVYNLAAHELNLAHSAYTTIISGMMKCARFEIAQARRCFVRATTSPKKEDALLNDMIDEACDFETDQFFESFDVPEVTDED